LVKKESFLRLMLAFAAGAFSFWLPVVLARLVFGELGILLTVTLLTLVLPVILCLALDFLAQWWTMPRPKLVLAMITGIWLTGPFFMMLSLTFTRGEGFHAPGAWSSVGLETALFPLSTFMMATYEGSLLAVLLTTLALTVFAFTSLSFGRFRLG
jgi:hypothetical protein